MRIKRLRIAHGMTQAVLATQAHVPQGFIAQLEVGLKTAPSLDTLRRLAKALRVRVGKLVD